MSTRLALTAQVISRLAAISSRYLSPKRVGPAVAVVGDAAEALLGLGERQVGGLGGPGEIEDPVGLRRIGVEVMLADRPAAQGA